jgi:hypothetical protein
VAGVLAAVRPAFADDIPIVTLTAAGPDRTIPVGKSFYLASKVKEDVTYVRAVVVRRRWALIASFMERASCGELIDRMKAPPKAALQAAPVGETEVTTLWKGQGDDPIYVGPAWSREELTGKQDVKLLIEGASTFFETGAEYCLYQFEVSTRTERDGALEKELWKCAANNAPGAALTKCVEKTVGDAPEDKRKDFEAAVGAAQTRLVQRAGSGKALPVVLDFLANAVTPEQFPPVMPATDPLPSAALALLVGHGALFPQSVTTKKGRTVEYFTLDAKVHVGGVGVTLDDKKLILYEDDTDPKSPRVEASLSTEKLTLPDSTLTLYDVLRWTRGELGPMSARELKELSLVLADPTAVLDAKQIEKVRAVEARAKLMSKVVLRAFAAQVPVPGTSDVAYAQLGKWLRTRLLPCNSGTVPAIVPNVPVANLCGAGTGWPNYAPAYDAGPIGELANRLGEVVDAQTALSTVSLKIVTINDSVTPVQKLDYQVAFTQKSWLFTYVTPIVGYAAIAKDGGWERYLGVQIHLFPNEVNEPQWSRGSDDWKRAFALELGAGTTGRFGPDDRYDGPKDLPLLFVGLAFHPVAYTSVTGGIAIFDQRTSTIDGERATVEVAPYVGLNLQFNVPALIGSMFSTPSSTTTE